MQILSLLPDAESDRIGAVFGFSSFLATDDLSMNLS